MTAVASSRAGASTCTRCPAPVIWALMPGGKKMPLDPAPNPGGTVAGYRDAFGGWRGRVLARGDVLETYERRYMTHFATCRSEVALREAIKAGTVVELARARAERERRDPNQGWLW